MSEIFSRNELIWGKKAQHKSEIPYIKEVFKLSEGEAAFLTTCNRGEGLLKEIGRAHD